MAEDGLELGIALLARLEHDRLDLAAVLDRLETVTTDPRRQRRILETAADRGVIELDRETNTVTPSSGRYVRFEREVVTREGEFTCRRCGAELSEGHFVRLDPGDLGPFGSTCIRKVLGRAE